MDIQLDAHDAVAFVRWKLEQFSLLVNPSDTLPNSRTALICTINEIWPIAQKKPKLRHAVIQALLGRSIESQNDLKWHETKTLLEVLHDEDFGRSCWRELQVHVEGDYFGEPWSFPPTRLL